MTETVGGDDNNDKAMGSGTETNEWNKQRGNAWCSAVEGKRIGGWPFNVSWFDRWIDAQINTHTNIANAAINDPSGIVTSKRRSKSRSWLCICVQK